MKIVRTEIIPVGRPDELGQGGEGEFLVSPLNAFPDYRRLQGEGFVGLRGGPAYAVLVRVHTDDGLYGVGSVGVGNGAAVYVLQHYLAPAIQGQDPFNTEFLWDLMYRSTLNIGRKGLTIEAISAIDIAIWDILGKATNQPVYNLLGGKTRESIQVYGSRLYAMDDLDELGRRAAHLVKSGFQAVKQRFGWGPNDGLAGMRRNLDLVRTVRDAIGPDIELMADAYMGWDVSYAVRMIRMIEDQGLNLRWVEEPVIPDDIDGYAEIRRSVRTPISGGEHEFTRYGFRELIQKRAVDILQPDVNRIGGITEARKIWAMAAANGLSVVPHAGQAHNYHLVISHLNSPFAEYFPHPSEGGVLDDDTLFYELFDGEPLAQNGHVTLSGKPGLGIDINETQIRRWKLESTQ